MPGPFLYVVYYSWMPRTPEQKARYAEKERQRRAADPQYNEKARARRAADPERVRAMDNARYASSDRTREVKKEASRRANQLRKPRIRGYMLSYRYGITAEQHDQMLADQGSCCAICATDMTAIHRGVNVDHCHQTGKVRALLCPACNQALGLMGDSPYRLEAAAAYIRRHRA